MGADPAAVEKNRRRRLVDRDSGGASARSDVRLIFLQPEHCKRAIDARAGSAGDAAAAEATARGPGPGRHGPRASGRAMRAGPIEIFHNGTITRDSCIGTSCA
jgi:hypothetical protein